MTHDGKLLSSLRYVSPCFVRPRRSSRSLTNKGANVGKTRPSFSPCDSANFSSLQGSLDLHDEKALHTPRCPRRPSTRTYEAEFTMPQPSANANQQRGQDYNRVGNLSGRYSASNNAGASNGGLTQRAVHNQPKAQRDGAEPARLRMVCGDCCLPSCYVKERVKMALAQQLDVATSGECVAVLTCPPYGGPFCLPYVPAARAACPEACTRASLWRAARGTLDGSVKALLTARVHVPWPTGTLWSSVPRPSARWAVSCTASATTSSRSGAFPR